MPLTIRQHLQHATKQLESVADDSKLEAEILLSHALNKPRSYLFAWPDVDVSTDVAEKFAGYLSRRLNKEPIAYITGKKEFWSMELAVTRDTLIPRPETEVLVEEVLKLFPDPNSQLKIADLGTGSGAIAIALAKERPHWTIYAIDLSENALAIARKNAHAFGLNQISFICGNWLTSLACSDLDIIVSNPPYITTEEWKDYEAGLSFEPQSALLSGQDGLQDIREICQSAKAHLKPGGCLLLEHGFSQGAEVRALLADLQYKAIRSVRDLSGQERVTI